MPRTKVSRTTKRNREAAYREDKIRECDSILDGYISAIASQGTQYLNEVMDQLDMMRQRTNKQLLKMKVSDLLAMNLNKLSDWTPNSTELGLSSSSLPMDALTSSTLMRSNSKVSNPNDEGYLTEDSNNRSADSAIHAPIILMREHQLRVGRTPGPLNSARARSARRSRSACNDIAGPQSLLKPKLSQKQMADHASRSKMRTPISVRPKAISADRTPMMCNKKNSPKSPATAFLRWPKPGELVLSACGSPVLAQVNPDKYANVNIPIGDGVFSMRPKKMEPVDSRFFKSLKPETLEEIRMLHANLNVIMTLAEKASQM